MEKVPPAEQVPLPAPAYGREHVERLGRTADRWAWRARKGNAKARATAEVLMAIAWALREDDEGALQKMARAAHAYLDELGERGGYPINPFVHETANIYEQIMASMERQIATVQRDDLKRETAAQWFLLKARQRGFDLPEAPKDDEAARAFLVRAIRNWRKKNFDDDRDRAESWTRAMADASGRKDAANAAKSRMKKPVNK